MTSDPIDDYAAVLKAQAKTMLAAGIEFRRQIAEYVQLAEAEETEKERVRWSHLRGEIAVRAVADLLFDLFVPVAVSLEGKPAVWVGAAYDAIEEKMAESSPQQYNLRELVAKYVVAWEAEDGGNDE